MDAWEVDYPCCQKYFSKLSSKTCQWVLKVIQANLALKSSIKVDTDFKIKKEAARSGEVFEDYAHQPHCPGSFPPQGPELDHFICTPHLAHSCPSLKSQHKSCFLRAALPDPNPNLNYLFPYCLQGEGYFSCLFSFIGIIIFVFFHIVFYCLSPPLDKIGSTSLLTIAYPVSTLPELSKCPLNE